MHRLSQLGRRDDGAVALITVLLTSMVFIGLCALVVDLGLARDTRRQAQNAADASALAAGNVVYLGGNAVDIPGATTAAKFYAEKNFGVVEADWAACTDSAALAYHPDTACISFDSATRPTAARVNAPIRQIKTPFAQIWGVSSVPVSAAAQVKLVAGGMADCGLCITGTGTHDLQNGDIAVSGADVAINGSLAAGPNGSITVISVSGGSINLQGDLEDVHNNTDFDPWPTIDQPQIIDPLASLVMPDYSALTIPGTTTNSCPGVPGIYDHLIACSAGMTPGLYVLTGETEMHGNEVVVANGVTLYLLCGTPALPLACAAGQSGGSLRMTGNAILTITAPTSGPSPGTAEGTKGLAIVADRNNTAIHTFRGNGSQVNSGTIYASSGTLDMRGNGAANSMDSLVVVKNLSFSGTNAAFNSAYSQSVNVSIESSDLHLSK